MSLRGGIIVMGYKLPIKVIQGTYFGVKKTAKSNGKFYLHFILK